MRILINLVLLFHILSSTAQLNTIQPGIYPWEAPLVVSGKLKGSKTILEGISPHFDFIKIHVTTQLAGAQPGKAHANENTEECIIVKEGKMKIILEGKTILLGPEDVMLLMPQQMHSIENIGATNLTYYVMSYTSKTKMNLERGEASGGTLGVHKDDLTIRLSSKGSGASYFDRPTAMCKRFEMHTTQLNKKGPSHEPHTHLETEIILMLSGKTTMTIAGKEFSAKEGDFYFINSELLHGVRNASQEPCSYFAFKWK